MQNYNTVEQTLCINNRPKFWRELNSIQTSRRRLQMPQQAQILFAKYNHAIEVESINLGIKRLLRLPLVILPSQELKTSEALTQSFQSNGSNQ